MCVEDSVDSYVNQRSGSSKESLSVRRQCFSKNARAVGSSGPPLFVSAVFYAFAVCSLFDRNPTSLNSGWILKIWHVALFKFVRALVGETYTAK